MHINFDAPWNASNKLPVYRWLNASQSAEDRKRLETMGNLVVPLQASKAISILSAVREQLSQL